MEAEEGKGPGPGGDPSELLTQFYTLYWPLGWELTLLCFIVHKMGTPLFSSCWVASVQQ